MSQAFNALLAAYRARDDGWRAARASGQPVVGYVGNTIPVEAITAAGALPWRVAPVNGSTAMADPYIEPFADLDARLIFERYIGGALDALDLLIIPRSTETQHKLFLALREAKRTGLASRGPALWLYDILHTQRASSRAYSMARTADLLARLGDLTGHAPGDADLAHAIADANATRRRLAELQQRRRLDAVSGWQAHIATGALAFMPPADGHRTLQAWLNDVPSVAAPGLRPRLLVKGVPLDHDALHAQVDELGATIVAEDDDWGSRAAAPLVKVTQAPIDGLVEHCWRERPCPRIHPQPLAGSWFAQALSAGGIEGVLFNLPRPDDIHGWTLPAERALAHATGLPSLVLRDDARNGDAVRAALAPFLAGLARR